VPAPGDFPGGPRASRINIYDEALSLVTKTAAYRILGNGVDRRMSRLLAEAVMRADRGL
jgi:hypothetical protein